LDSGVKDIIIEDNFYINILNEYLNRVKNVVCRSTIIESASIIDDNIVDNTTTNVSNEGSSSNSTTLS
jgi:hypothetical protein